MRDMPAMNAGQSSLDACFEAMRGNPTVTEAVSVKFVFKFNFEVMIIDMCTEKPGERIWSASVTDECSQEIEVKKRR